MMRAVSRKMGELERCSLGSGFFAADERGAINAGSSQMKGLQEGDVWGPSRNAKFYWLVVI
jgi:hypothetical protein